MKTKLKRNSAGLVSVHQWVNDAGEIDVMQMRPELGLHTNGLLRHDEWLEIDTAVLDVVRTGLVGIQDLLNAGLTHPLGGLGTVLSGYERIGDLTEANVSLEGDTAGEEDDLNFDTVFVPVPIIHKDFSMSLRKLLASRRLGEGLDTTTARVATRIVREKMEAMLFSGVSKKVGGFPIYGYTTRPGRITGTAIGDFGTAGNAYKTFVKALGEFATAGFNGPFNFYVANPQYNEMLNLLGTNDRNELEIIKTGLPQIASIKPSFNLTAGHLVGVQMTSDVVDLAIAEDITAIQWDSMGGMRVHFRVMTALAPRIKVDMNDKCGVLHYTGA